jgi:hypothetical protein
MINTQDSIAAVLPAPRPTPWLPVQATPTGRAVETLQGIPAAEVSAELDRIVGSDEFPASERNKRVLRHVVQCSLEGREEKITAYDIATHVYGRPEDFNAVKDPIVRIEMSRLRRDLELYYLKGGRHNPLRLSIPKGGYFPHVIRTAEKEAPAPTGSATASPFLVTVLRAALSALGGRQEEAASAWQELLRANPSLVGNLHQSVARETGDEEVTRLIVDGVLRAAGRRQ